MTRKLSLLITQPLIFNAILANTSNRHQYCLFLQNLIRLCETGQVDLYASEIDQAAIERDAPKYGSFSPTSVEILEVIRHLMSFVTSIQIDQIIADSCFIHIPINAAEALSVAAALSENLDGILTAEPDAFIPKELPRSTLTILYKLPGEYIEIEHTDDDEHAVAINIYSVNGPSLTCTNESSSALAPSEQFEEDASSINIKIKKYKTSKEVIKSEESVEEDLVLRTAEFWIIIDGKEMYGKGESYSGISDATMSAIDDCLKDIFLMPSYYPVIIKSNGRRITTEIILENFPYPGNGHSENVPEAIAEAHLDALKPLIQEALRHSNVVND
jgi:hypothetical protein